MGYDSGQGSAWAASNDADIPKPKRSYKKKIRADV